jgi:hypothetical protein|tara:strand:+ start:1245 stop:1448 length:204 start_codon:yes stop_codon:yes gene_type:complete
MLRSFTTKIKSIVTIKYKHNKHIKKILTVKEDYSYSKYTIDNINKQNKQKKQDAIHKYWRYHHGDEI